MYKGKEWLKEELVQSYLKESVVYLDGKEFQKARYFEISEKKLFNLINQLDEPEKEPLFYLPLGVVRSDGNEFYLAKTSLDVIGIDSSSERYVKDKRNAHYYRFTEKEIKDYNEYYWPFAVPVVEVSND